MVRKQYGFRGEVKLYKSGSGNINLSVVARDALGLIKKGDRADYFAAPNMVLLVKKGIKLENVLEGIKVLAETVKLRWKE